MATRYWVGGTGTWNTTSTTKWSATSGGTAGASVPTAADDVVFDAASGSAYTVTLTGALACLSLTVGAPASGVVTLTSTGTITISGGLTVAAGTLWNATGTLTFAATSAKTITTNGVALACSVTLNGAGGTWTLGGALTLASTRTLTMTAGSLNLAGYTLTTGLFATSGTASGRVLTMGTGGNFVLTGADANTLISTASITAVNQFSPADTPVFNIASPSSFGVRTVNFSTYWKAGGAPVSINILTGNYNSANGVLNLPSGAKYKDLTSLAAATCSVAFTGTDTAISISGNLDIAGGAFLLGTVATFLVSPEAATATIKSYQTLPALTLVGSSKTLQVLANLTCGAVSVPSACTLDISNKILASSAFTASGGSTIAFGASGEIRIRGAASVPLSLDDSSTSITLTGVPKMRLEVYPTKLTPTVLLGDASAGLDLTIVGYVDTNFPATASLTSFATNGSAAQLKNLTSSIGGLSGAVYVNSAVTLSSADALAVFSGLTIYSNCTAGNTLNLTSGGTAGFQAIAYNTGTLKFLDAQAFSNLTHQGGTLDANGQNVSCTKFTSNSNAVRTLAMGIGTWTITGSGACWDVTATNLTVVLNGGAISMTSASAKTFAGAGKAWPRLNQGGSGALTITGSNTFNGMSNTVQPCSVLFTAGTTNNFYDFTLTGVPGSLVTIGSVTAAQHTLNRLGSGLVQVGYCSISYSNATPANTWYAAP